jgi:hypothetical protein
LDTFEVHEIESSPELKKDLADFTHATTINSCSEEGYIVEDTPQQPLLYLRIQAAAEFYTTNHTLMNNPPPVLVDISRFYNTST